MERNSRQPRLRAGGPFDYTQEVYSPLLWVMEGFTTYYDVILLRRAGLIRVKRALELLGERIASYRQQPGRLVQSLEESSVTTWIKFYRQDENYINTGISYYLKGSLVALMLDMQLRWRSDNETSLDNLMRYLWDRYGKQDVGFTVDQFLSALEQVAGHDLGDYLQRYVQGLEELPLEEAISHAGLELKSERKSDMPAAWAGFNVKSEHGNLIVQNVLRDSPAEDAGLMAADRLVAFDGYELQDESFLKARLKEKEVGDEVRLHLFRYGVLLEKPITLAEAPPDKVMLRQVASPSTLQRRIFESWLEAGWEELSSEKE